MLKPLEMAAARIAGSVVPALLLAAVMLAAAMLPARAGPNIVFDMRTGAVIHAEYPDAPWYPASITKLMTAYVALSAVREGRLTLDTLLPASRNATAQPPSKIGIALGQTVTLQNALYLMIVKSANDIAVTIAEGVSGSIPDFAEEMNATARRLGMTGSHFVNPNGLPEPEQYTTARDMGILARALSLEFPESVRLTRLPYVKIGKTTVHSYNPLIGRYAGADGMKTGFICASGFNMVASATRRGQRIVAIVFGATSPDERRVTAEHLLDLGFSIPRYDLHEKPTLKSLPRDGNEIELVNMRPLVCGDNRVPASDVPGLRPFDYTGPVVSVAFGPVQKMVPLPKPRPADIAVAALAPAPDAETVKGGDGEPVAVASDVPLPRPRPAIGH